MSTIKGGLVNAFNWSCIYCIGCGLYSNMDKRRLNNKKIVSWEKALETGLSFFFLTRSKRKAMKLK